MLRSVTLYCFRQHEHRVFNFTTGINVIRGANEGGKTTILEAVTYAVGGAPALSEPFEKVVTWDRKESELRVVLDIEIAGVTYLVDRSAKGATLTSPSLEKKVTGQREVSAFFTNLLGGSAKTLALLLMATQAGLQDVITAGPGEVSQLVHKLGSMDVVDAVIKEAEKSLITGNEKVAADRVTSCEERHAACQAAIVPVERIVELNAQHREVVGAADTADKVVSGVWKQATEAAHINLTAGLSKEGHVRSLEGQCQVVIQQLEASRAALVQATSVQAPQASVLAGLKIELNTLTTIERRRRNKARLDLLLAKKPITVWDAEVGTDAQVEVEQERTKAREKVTAIQAAINSIQATAELVKLDEELSLIMRSEPLKEERAAIAARIEGPILADEIAVANAIVTDLMSKLAVPTAMLVKPLPTLVDTCPTCGQKFVDAEARAEHVQKELGIRTRAETEADRLKGELATARASLTTLQQQMQEIRRGLQQEQQALKDRESAMVSVAVGALRSQKRTIEERVAAERDSKIKELASAQNYARTIETLIDETQPLLRFISEVHGDGGSPISVDTKVYPPKVVWVDDMVNHQHRIAAVIQADIDEEARKVNTWAKAQGMVESLTATVAQQQTMASSIEAKVAEAKSSLGDVDKLRQAYDDAVASQVLAEEIAGQARAKERALASELNTLVAESERLKAAWLSVNEELGRYKQELAELSYNNEFVKAVKLLKPQITEYMWAKSLNVISGYFSNLRGQSVKVTRDNDGFLFNGRPATSLSGSGKDILALAIRAALTRTFLPVVGFMTLDEPAHGSDEARTAKMLAFLKSSGFQQIILASHDPLSESVADNVINIGEV